ncbi:hypothetical protein ATI14_1295 [Pseudomonas tolaasii NCPPB 2192]|uniref:Uncharacterized protein n=1 Tax=Pseudomonas tolaasii NCPPB 2192 TaxID=564423 RepID=A0ABX4QCP8_PSETO|nr:hypothetical protein B5P22_14580 [Pseudomonas tolaasii]KAB0477193.1 hypothetical protein F7R12_07130 [Pseudomonas tolaasii]PKA74485.1 hypothetical protein ATI14_1295 [Pseudomonas tolaasii NCPPB 2192]
MKNSYHLNKLQKVELSLNENKEYISSFLLKTTLSGEIIETFDSLADLRIHLNSDLYYVAHNLVARKGGKIIFKGELYKATLSDLLEFLGDSIKSNDLRELLISPVKAYPNSKVFYCTEDAFYMYAAE